MSKSRRNRPNRKRDNGLSTAAAISAEANSQKKDLRKSTKKHKGNSAHVQKTGSGLSAAGKPRRFLFSHQRGTSGSLRKEGGWSVWNIVLMSILAAVLAVGGVVIWDMSGNEGYLLSSVQGLFTPQEEEKEKRYDPLPINKSKPPKQIAARKNAKTNGVAGIVSLTGSAPGGGLPQLLAGLPMIELNQAAYQNANLVWIPGGWFWMGSDDPNPRHAMAQPIHKVYVDGFWMSKYETTNAEWAQFVKETGFVTYCEIQPDPKDFPDVPKETVLKTKPFSLVFHFPERLKNLKDERKWWKIQAGANWRQPLGPGRRTIAGMDKHPVVHICWNDAQEFLKWKNSKFAYRKGWEFRLPTEAEWEFAARGGLNQATYPWGEEFRPKDKWMANVWQGSFPMRNTIEDKFLWTAPVGSFPANNFGLYDMGGNVWEWCNDWYREDYYKKSRQRNPAGPLFGLDPLEPGLPKRVQRGGSFLCDVNYCQRYLTYARGKGEVKSSANHVGFRYVLAPKVVQQSFLPLNLK